MPREQAQAIYRVGRAFAEGDPERTLCFEQAACIFQRLGAIKELAELRHIYPSIATQRSQI
jgi:hypothetical protein